jgi:outer membrane receptor protein involved in Fe transport
VQQSSSYLILNASAALSHDPWRATLYITNLANKEEILVPPYNPNAFDDLTNDYIVNEPRMIGVRLAYMF